MVRPTSEDGPSTKELVEMRGLEPSFGRRVRQDVTHRLSPLNRRLRMEFLAGAEADSRRRLGRGLTAKELERVLRHYPGDIGPRSSFRELPGRP